VVVGASPVTPSAECAVGMAGAAVLGKHNANGGLVCERAGGAIGQAGHGQLIVMGPELKMLPKPDPTLKESAIGLNV
jgi:hypothetical protein